MNAAFYIADAVSDNVPIPFFFMIYLEQSFFFYRVSPSFINWMLLLYGLNGTHCIFVVTVVLLPPISPTLQLAKLRYITLLFHRYEYWYPHYYFHWVLGSPSDSFITIDNCSYFFPDNDVIIQCSWCCLLHSISFDIDTVLCYGSNRVGAMFPKAIRIPSFFMSFLLSKLWWWWCYYSPINPALRYFDWRGPPSYNSLHDDDDLTLSLYLSHCMVMMIVAQLMFVWYQYIRRYIKLCLSNEGGYVIASDTCIGPSTFLSLYNNVHWYFFINTCPFRTFH